MGTLKIGSAKNMVGITINPRHVLFNDNNVKYIKSDATEIWSYINPLIPKLTDYVGSNGVASATSEFNSGWKAWYAFDDVENTAWLPANKATGHSLMYEFKVPTNVIKIDITTGGTGAPVEVPLYFEASNGDNNWVLLKEFMTSQNGEHTFANDNYYTQYRLRGGMLSQDTAGYRAVYKLQMYGSQLKGLIPTMTSNTEPSGEASANGITRSELKGKKISQAYTIFAGVSDNVSSRTYFNLDENVADRYVQYKFDKPKVVKLIYLENNVDGSKYYVSSFKIQASKDGVIFNDISPTIEHSGGNSFGQYHPLENNTPYIAYRLIPLSHVHPANENEMNLGARLQFFG